MFQGFYFTKMILIVQFAAWLHLVQCTWILIASLLANEFSLETILQVQRDFLAIPAMHFKASRPTIKATQQDVVIRYQQLVTFHTAL